MKLLINASIFSGLMLISCSSSAVWLNTTAKVKHIITYASKDTVLVTLDVHGTQVQACSNRAIFAISSTNSPEQRARMLAILLAAQAAGKSVTVSYSDVDSCEPWHANPHVYRKITRLTSLN